MNYLREGDVLVIRSRLAGTVLAQRAFGQVDPLYPDRVSSAVARQTTGFGTKSKYTTVEAVAATLFFGLCKGHAFENGNKRTALVSMLVFLEQNSVWMVDTTEDDLYDMATQVAANTFAGQDADDVVARLDDWLRPRLRAKTTGQRRMRFRELQQLLEGHGCEFDAPKGNYIKIRREVDGRVLTVRTGRPNAHFEVPAGEVKKIRLRLELDEEHGWDSGAVFDLEQSIDGFTNQYRQLLDRLADM